VTDFRETGTNQRSRAHTLREKPPKKRSLPSPTLFTLPAPRHPHPDGGLLPAWLCEELQLQHPIAFRATAVWTRCPKCQAIILTGLDDPVIGSPATVDPTPLNPVQELICALEHRPTYRLHHTGSTAHIQHRDRWQKPAGTPNAPPVVPAHRCGHRYPGLTIPAEPERQHHAQPPF
jgi:hypothetical protein